MEDLARACHDPGRIGGQRSSDCCGGTFGCNQGFVLPRPRTVLPLSDSSIPESGMGDFTGPSSSSYKRSGSSPSRWFTSRVDTIMMGRRFEARGQAYLGKYCFSAVAEGEKGEAL